MSGSSASTCSGLESQGTSVSLAPCSRSWRTIESLIPVSMPTTCGPSPSKRTASGGRHLAGEVGARHRGLGGDPLARLGLGDRGREDAAAHRPAVAQVADQGAGVDAADPRRAGHVEPVEPAALGGGGVLAVLRVAHHDPAGVDGFGLHRRAGDAVVADQRVGEDDDLARVGGVGDRLLVAGHRGVEDDLADRLAGVADEIAVEAEPVLEQQVCGFGRFRHQEATPREKERRRKATWPAATVTRTRPVSVRPSAQELDERLS